MSKILSELLNAKEPMFTLSLRELEELTGRPDVDIRLGAEIIGKVNLKTRELGLDPSDSTGKEIYHGLMHLIKLHDQHLAKALGGSDPDDVKDMLPRIKKAVDNLDIPKSCWVLKNSVAKRMLLKRPPKNIMKHLGYRSVDSMLKRENIAEIYGAMRFAESPDWLNKFLQNYKSLKPTDFQSRKIQILVMPEDRWGQIAKDFVRKKKHNITHLKELGVIMMLPMPIDRLKGITITAFPLLIHYVNEIRLYSAFFRLKQTKSNFGSLIVDTLIAKTGADAIIVGNNVHWRVIQRYYGKLGSEYHPEIFEPHVQPEDLHWRKAEEVLYNIEPSLNFWRDLDFVAVQDKSKPVSFNLMDMAVSYVNGLEYEDRAIYHMREALWNEIFIRYMGEKNLEDQILNQLDNESIKPEKLDLVGVV